MAPSKLDLHSLIVFYYVASEGSVTAAADKLCLTQPTVTYHVHCLERNVGLKLLDIKRKKVALTQAGNGLLRYVGEIYRQMSGAEKFLEDLRDGSFRIGISTTFGMCLASVAAHFRMVNPRVRLVIRSATSFEIAEQVVNSQIDLGIAVGMDYGNSRLKSVEIAPPQRLVLVAAPSSAVARKERLDLMALCRHTLVLGPPTSATRRILLKRLQVGGCITAFPVIIEVDSPELGLGLIESGQGVGLYHIRSVQKAVREGRLKELPFNRDIRVEVCALLRADAPEHPMADRFISLVSEDFRTQAETPSFATAT